MCPRAQSDNGVRRAAAACSTIFVASKFGWRKQEPPLAGTVAALKADAAGGGMMSRSGAVAGRARTDEQWRAGLADAPACAPQPRNANRLAGITWSAFISIFL